MDLKILMILLLYYVVLSLFFLLGSGLYDDYEVDITLNDSAITDGEIDTGGLFGTGVSFGRFLGFIGFGLGLPDDTPTWFSVMFSAWQTIVLIFTIGFIIASIWNG